MNFRWCGKIKSSDKSEGDILAFTISHPNAQLVTCEAFGCVLHEQKEEAAPCPGE